MEMKAEARSEADARRFKTTSTCHQIVDGLSVFTPGVNFR